MEALQLLKFGLRQGLDFSAGLMTTESEMVDTVEDEPDYLAKIASLSGNEGMDQLISVVGRYANDDEESG